MPLRGTVSEKHWSNYQKIRVRGGNEKSPSSRLLFLMSNLISNVNFGKDFFKNFWSFPKVSKLEKMMILDVAEMDAASGELDHCNNFRNVFVSGAKVYAPQGSDAFVVLAIFKKWNKKIQKPRPFQLLFFLGGEGFQAIGRCFFFLRNPPRIPPPKIPHLPHWSAGLRPLGTLKTRAVVASVPAISIAGCFSETGPFTYPPGN